MRLSAPAHGRNLAEALNSCGWPALDPDAAAAVRAESVLRSPAFNALAWSADELAVIAQNIFLEVRSLRPPRPPRPPRHTHDSDLPQFFIVIGCGRHARPRTRPVAPPAICAARGSGAARASLPALARPAAPGGENRRPPAGLPLPRFGVGCRWRRRRLARVLSESLLSRPEPVTRRTPVCRAPLSQGFDSDSGDSDSAHVS